MFMTEFGQDYHSIISMPFYEAQLILEHAKEIAKAQKEGQQNQQEQMGNILDQPKIPEIKIPEVKIPNLPKF